MDVIPEENFHVDDKMGWISIEFGKREGLKTGYPEIRIARLRQPNSKQKYVMHSVEPAPRDPGYDQYREPTVYELRMFVQIARIRAPKAQMTQVLIEEARKFLLTKREAIVAKLKEYDETLAEISS
jgi:hypothetical protein